MSTILMHIGTQKTATTSLQEILAEIETPLRDHGILYPRAGRSGNVRVSHHRLVWSLTRERGCTDESVWSELRDELGADSSRLAVVSCEDFAPFDDALVARVAKHLEGHDVKVVVYLRNQLDFVLSLYKQWVKSDYWKYRHSLKQFIAENLHRCDYAGILDRWAGAFGEGTVEFRLYDKIKRGCGMERDFLELLGIGDLAENGALSWKTERVNVSPRDDSTRALRVLNVAEALVPNVPLKRRVCGAARRRLIESDSWAVRCSQFGARIVTPPLSSPSDIAYLRERTAEFNPRFLSRISDPADRALFDF